MVSTKHPHEAKNPALMNQTPGRLDKTLSKPSSSNKATHGSLTSASTGGGQSRAGNWDGNGDASSGNGHREAWALQDWLEQAPGDEPWSAGSRRS